MNRIQALMTAGVTTALSAAAIAATAAAQSVFTGGGATTDQLAGDGPGAVAWDLNQPGTDAAPQIVVRELEPIVIERSSAAPNPAGRTAVALPSADRTAGVPPGDAAAVAQTSPSVSAVGRGDDDGPPHDVVDDRGGDREREDRTEPGDDRDTRASEAGEGRGRDGDDD